MGVRAFELEKIKQISALGHDNTTVWGTYMTVGCCVLEYCK